ncbi:hypothetical protein [Mycoplasmopsis agassizii]|uniref:Uncharacterized protein n=1 Tax=Mycoplasmopsis agassizii TaxID=33922 RepID=A0ABX4H488_9BACT|nr:hypothetical protein [Mycoplasmopsis agassizii]PAF54706.1 hypothetical protein CJF60_03125 [Mycoplasmopsis agassizii]SMC15971.1 hypothetical protein SAMN02745179_00177 [Mycoplasmopsis agassizii]
MENTLFISKLIVFIIPIAIFATINLILYLVFWSYFYRKTNDSLISKTGLSKNFVYASRKENHKIYFFIYCWVLLSVLVIQIALFIGGLVSFARGRFLSITALTDDLAIETFRNEGYKWLGISIGANLGVDLIFIFTSYITKKIIRSKSDNQQSRVDNDELLTYSGYSISSETLPLEFDHNFRRRRIIIKKLQTIAEKNIQKIIESKENFNLDSKIYVELSQYVVSLWVATTLMNNQLRNELIKEKIKLILLKIENFRNYRQDLSDTENIKIASF